MNPEELVPSLELCKEIPDEKFLHSALVWERAIRLDGKELAPRINLRQSVIYQNIIYPAPTLQEIMEELYSEAEGTCDLVEGFRGRDGWEVVATYECHDDSGYRGEHSSTKHKENPAEAALKVWLERGENER